jgi:uncharacterized protein (DUF58 family)
MDRCFETILLKAKEDVYSHLSGENLSHILGQGYDFSELREYDTSDDIRHISWINSAKLGQPYVKKMHEDRELNVAVCSLLDGRFLVGIKRELLEYVVAVLAYSSYEANNLFSALYFVGSKLHHFEATKNLYLIENGLKNLSEVDLLGQKIIYENLLSLSLDTKHLLFVVGDFLDRIDLSVLAQKHEVIAVIIRDDSEENPMVSSKIQLINPQNNQPLHQTLSKRAILHYKAKLLEHDEQLFQHFHESGIKYIKISNKEELFLKLEQLFL